MGSIIRGRISIDWQTALAIVARGKYDVEQRCWLPKLPEGVAARSVHNNYISGSFDYILESEKPVEGWTQEVEEGVEIPLSQAWTMMCKVVHTAKEPENIIKTMTLQRLLMNINNDLREDADSGIKMSMTIEEYLNNLYNETE
ncbi:hypothetical protein HWC53_gp197 [Bacillus phage vB_BmeM-Goe8]|uniref:Uncharacterized protein n=1 Tax=Bacillus phage vB_BmeM-Goe8 TaxID=2593638 RepID=A0A516KMR7_9CAUD|nr:hypothetical protein HWC53_gp197 [Bacillus phage vB_BmeM-Goe8]QDP42892.1 hypothetical protein Goe8_c01190 [Bacillus phage vB_BmeM-Goe8]